MAASQPNTGCEVLSVVHVTVHGLDGQGAIEAHVPPESTVLALKEQIAEVSSGIPALGQSLLCGVTVLDDSECIGELVESGSCNLSLTLVKSNVALEEAY